MNTIAGHIVDVVARQIKKGILYIDGGKIVNFEASEAVPDQYIIPGFVDAHIHIESSMMLPSGSRKVFAGGKRPVPWNLRYSSTSLLTVCSIHLPDGSTLSVEVPYNKPGQPCAPCRWIERREARATDGRLGGKRRTIEGRRVDARWTPVEGRVDNGCRVMVRTSGASCPQRVDLLCNTARCIEHICAMPAGA